MAEFAPSSTSAPGEQQSAPSASASSESSVVSARQQLSEQLERLMQQGLEAARGAPGSLQVEPPDTKLPLHSGAGIIVATLDPGQTNKSEADSDSYDDESDETSSSSCSAGSEPQRHRVRRERAPRISYRRYLAARRNVEQKHRLPKRNEVQVCERRVDLSPFLCASAVSGASGDPSASTSSSGSGAATGSSTVSLYPLCRAWLSNLGDFEPSTAVPAAHHWRDRLPLPPPNALAARRHRKAHTSAEAYREAPGPVRHLPPPDLAALASAERLRAHIVPKPLLGDESGRTYKELIDMPESDAPEITDLLDKHIERWQTVRSAAARVHRARRRAFEPSGQLLAAIFQRSSGSYSLGNHPKL